jgi:hypothetical protein
LQTPAGDAHLSAHAVIVLYAISVEEAELIVAAAGGIEAL